MVEKKTEKAVEEAVEGAPRQEAIADAVDEGELSKTAAKKAAGRKYPRERLVRESEAFVGQPPHVVAGALADLKADEFTVNQTETAIKNWLGAEE